ncbi:hypothetical protein ACI68E_000948 [Malassezia pachydermatis]
MKWSSIVLALAMASAAMAREWNCKPYMTPGTLLSKSIVANRTETFEISRTKKVDGHPALVKVDSTDQTFQFYECDPPSPNYKQGGQIRSASNTSLCLSPGDLYRYNYHVGNFTKYPEDADERISLEPCATVHSLTMRRQWFMVTETENKCLSRVSQQGWKTDGTSDVVVLSENGVALGSNIYDKKESFLYLSSNESDAC